MNMLSVSILLAISFVTISAVPSCPAVNEEIATLLPHDSDCSKFYKCETGVAIVYDCPAGLYFNPVLSVCDYPEEVDCNGSGGNGGSTSPTQGTTDGGNGGSTGGGSTGGGSTGGGSSGGPECPAVDGEFVTLFPHEDCTKFWKCDRGVAVEKDCPAGLYFNPTLFVCDYPEDAGCDGTGIGGGTTPTPTQGTTDGGNGGSTGGGSTGGGSTGGGSSGGPECPAVDGEFVTLFPHEDCTKFWKCDRGVAVEKDCPAGLYFNPTLFVCDYPEDAGCDGTGIGGGTTPTPTQGTTDGGSSSQGTTGGTTLTTPNPSDGYCQTLGCPELNGEWVYFLPYPGDCRRFCKCDWGKPYEFTCPSNLYFDTILDVCVFPEDTDCTNAYYYIIRFSTMNTLSVSILLAIGFLTTSAIPNCPDRNEEFATLLPHESDCSKFYKCEAGVAVVYDCPAGLYFNPVLSVCDYPEEVDCGGSGGSAGSTSPTEGSTEGGNGGSPGGGSTVGGGSDGPECPAEDGEFVTLFPHTDCSKFWKCDRGVAVEQNCPAGLLFNPTLLVCDYPEDAGCDGTGIGGGTTPSPTQGTTDGGNGGSTGGGSTVGGGSDGPKCPAEDGEFVTLFPHVDCSKFWKCDRGVAVEQDCPAGLLFNPTLLVCDYPEDAGCNGSGVGGGTTPSPTQGTTDAGSSSQGTTGGTTQTTSNPIDGYCQTLSCPEVNGEWVYFLPYPGDCRRFCKCDWGKPFEFTCPSNLFFDHVLDVCDFQENVACINA
nr:chondroitin proteoglycan-2-like [Onthophagus taurus]